LLIIFYLVTAIDVLVAAGFAIAGIVQPSIVVAGPPTEASRIFALFAAARAVPLAIVTLVAIGLGAITAVEWLGALAGIIQLADFCILGLRQRAMAKAIGPLVLAILQFLVIILRRNSAAG
jgi:hypothetical protein